MTWLSWIFPTFGDQSSCIERFLLIENSRRDLLIDAVQIGVESHISSIFGYRFCSSKQSRSRILRSRRWANLVFTSNLNCVSYLLTLVSFPFTLILKLDCQRGYSECRASFLNCFYTKELGSFRYSLVSKILDRLQFENSIEGWVINNPSKTSWQVRLQRKSNKLVSVKCNCCTRILVGEYYWVTRRFRLGGCRVLKILILNIFWRSSNHGATRVSSVI